MEEGMLRSQLRAVAAAVVAATATVVIKKGAEGNARALGLRALDLDGHTSCSGPFCGSPAIATTRSAPTTPIVRNLAGPRVGPRPVQPSAIELSSGVIDGSGAIVADPEVGVGSGGEGEAEIE
ncbi:unnamed protein product, partial [Discosporangium mesarthrocarpum]